MKICFFGSSLVSSYWNGAATYYRGLLRALAQLGHQVNFYEPDAFGRQQHRDIDDPHWAQVIVYPASREGWQWALEQGTRQADLLVKASGIGVFDRELETAVPNSRRAGMTVAFWDVDAPATLESIAADPQSHLRTAIPQYDLVLTYGGGQPVIDAYRGLGARRCVAIYNGLDPQTHYPAPRREQFTCDLSFLGNRLPDREARVEEFFFKSAELLPQRRFLLGGAGWDNKLLAANVRRLGHVGTGDHNALFSSGLATLNVNRASMARYGFSPPTRVFEAAGAGACIITDVWPGIELFFEPDTEILTASDGAAVAAIVRSLTPERARRIGAAALHRVRCEHTYTQRASTLMKVLTGSATQREAAA
jgi:spore maturation protein CgeB